MEELRKQLKEDNARRNKEKAEKAEKENNNKKKNGKKGSNKQSPQQQQKKKGKENNQKNGNTKNNKKQSEQNKKSQQNKPQVNNKKIKEQKVDKKLVKKFNKDCLGQNKSIEINNDTEKMIIFGLSQKENILLREEENFEKIAVKLYEVLLNDKNLKNKNKSKIITLDKMYGIIFNKTKLNEDRDSFLALVLELLSQIETKKSCLMAVDMLESGDILNKYFKKIPDIKDDNVVNEFDEYGLNYAYPLDNDIYDGLKGLINNKCTLTEILQFLTDLAGKQKIFTNYKTMKIVLEYVLKSFYFAKCEEKDDEKNEELAKKLFISGEIKKKTEFGKIISLLHCKPDNKDNDDDDDDEEDEEEEDVDDDVDSHSLLILSNIISVSSSLNNNNNGLLSLLKTLEIANLIKFPAINKFWIDGNNDKYTISRLSAISKLTDWYSELDARQARIAMERDNNEYEDDGAYDNSYAGNLYEKPKHKTAADYQAFSLID